MIRPNRPNLPRQSHLISAQHWLFWRKTIRRNSFLAIQSVYMAMSAHLSILSWTLIMPRLRLSTRTMPLQQLTMAKVDPSLLVIEHFLLLFFCSWLGRTVVHQTVSLTLDDSTKQISAREVPNDSENGNQAMTKVKMREHSSKKKKSLRDLTSRISLPPELKNGFSLHKQPPSINNNNNNNHPQQSSALNLTNKLKLNHQLSQQHQRSSYYQTSSLSSQTLNHVLHQSNSSLLRLSPSQLNTSLSGQLSRNEQRLSMLDLGFGKIESYIKLEKLGEGKRLHHRRHRLLSTVYSRLGTYATVYKGKSHLLNGYIALKEIRLEQEEGTWSSVRFSCSKSTHRRSDDIECWSVRWR